MSDEREQAIKPCPFCGAAPEIEPCPFCGAAPEIEPCPFCGAAPEIEPWHGGPPTKVMISCPNDECRVSPQVTGRTKERAATDWNERYVEDALREGLRWAVETLREDYGNSEQVVQLEALAEGADHAE